MIEFFAFILILLFFVSAWHFVYENALASTARFHLRNELFALRDKVRHEIISNNFSPEEKQGVLFVHDGVSLYINSLPRLNVITLHDAIKMLKTKEFSGEVEKRLQAINRVQNKEVVDAFLKAHSAIRRAILWNCGSWVIYILPLITTIFYFKSMKNILDTISNQIILMSPSGANQLKLSKAV